MQNDANSAERWLDNEDSSQREDRLARLRWMETLMPNVDWMIFGGGLISKHVFEEARHCFLYGQFLAAIVMGLSFIEISLGAAFYGIGRNDLERAGIAELAEEALKMEWITKEDFEAIERIRVYRNPVTHSPDSFTSYLTSSSRTRIAKRCRLISSPSRRCLISMRCSPGTISRM